MFYFNGHNEMSFPTGFRWLKKSSWISLHRRNITLPLTENSNDCQNGCKSETIVTSDARYTTRQIASMVGISFQAAHLILKHNLKMRRNCARWIPHLLTNEQKRARVQSAKNVAETISKLQCTVFCKRGHW